MTQPTPSMSASQPSKSTAAQAMSSSRALSTGNGLRYPSNKKSIYDRNRDRTRNAELSRAAFAYMFVEMIRYAQSQVRDVGGMEARLNMMGYPLGVRLLDLLLSRTSTSSTQPPTGRPLRIIALLQFITNTLWRHLFAHPADALEQSVNEKSHYMVFDNKPLASEYISVPKEAGDFNPSAYVAGIIEGVCDAAGFTTLGAKGQGVTAHWANRDEEGGGGGMWPDKTVFLIKFSPEVIEREEVLAKGEK